MEKETRTSIRGIKIKSIAKICLVSCILLMIVTYVGLARVDDSYRNLIQNTNDCLEGERCALSLERSSDYLTDQVRLFVISQNPQNMYHYFEEINGKNREKMVRRLRELYKDTDQDTVDQLEKALQESHALEQMEVHAMRVTAHLIGMNEEDLPDPVSSWTLTPEEEQMSKEDLQKTAYELVYGTAYLHDKQQIETSIADTLSLLASQMELRQKDRAMDLKHTLTNQRLAVFLMTALIGVVFTTVWILIVYPLNEHVRSIESNQKWRQIGGYEIRYLADIYNKLYDKNEMYQERLEYEADHDALTGIYNRAAFEKQKDILRDKKVGVALMLADIDNFKRVNDTLGHDMGDIALKKVADVLTQLKLKEHYCAARIGGDEFALLLFDVKEDVFPEIEAEIHRMNELMESGVDGLPPLSVSIGIAFSEQGYSNDLFRHADYALYYTKKHGRKGGTVFTKEMEI